MNNYFPLIESLFYGLLGLGGTVLLFLLFREITTWYLKLNEIVMLLKEIRDVLVEIRTIGRPEKKVINEPRPGK